MRRLRVAIGLLFVVASVVFGTYVVREQLLTDHNPPVISCEAGKEEITVSVNDDESALLDGLTALDEEDGDLTDAIRVASMSNFINGHKRTVEYIVFDGSNLAGTFERTVQYSDYTAPRIRLLQPLRMRASNDGIDFSDMLMAEDPLDGDITQNIRTITSNDYYYDRNAVEYFYTLQVSSSAGAVCTVPVSVMIVDSSDPTEMAKYYPILSEYIFYTSKGTAVDVKNSLIGLERNGVSYLYAEDVALEASTFEKVTVSASVNYEEAGVYPVDISYTSSAGITAVTKAYIVVEDVQDGE